MAVWAEDFWAAGFWAEEFWAEDASGSESPVAEAGPNQYVSQGATVTLDATQSSDDVSIASYSWEQTGGTSVTLSDATAAQPTFTAPSTDEVLTFVLTVTDGDGQTDTDTVLIAVGATIVGSIQKPFQVSSLQRG